MAFRFSQRLRASIVAALTFCSIVSVAVPVTAAPVPVARVDTRCSSPFPDVSAGSPFCADVTWLVQHKVAAGYADGRFLPRAAVSRQAMAAFLYHYANPGQTAEKCTAPPYPDVPPASPFCGDVYWLRDNNIAGGYPDGTFHPAQPVSRQAMASFMALVGVAKLVRCSKAPFADVPVTSPFCADIIWLVNHHVTAGFSDGRFHPAAAVSRQAMAAFLHRLYTATH